VIFHILRTHERFPRPVDLNLLKPQDVKEVFHRFRSNRLYRWGKPCPRIPVMRRLLVNLLTHLTEGLLRYRGLVFLAPERMVRLS
jgi:hypothetical protein